MDKNTKVAYAIAAVILAFLAIAAVVLILYFSLAQPASVSCTRDNQCGAYTCNTGTGICRTNCSYNYQCGSGYVCQNNNCVAAPARSTLNNPVPVNNCGAYAARPTGGCWSSCLNQAQCATGYTCDDGNCVPEVAAAVTTPNSNNLSGFGRPTTNLVVTPEPSVPESGVPMNSNLRSTCIPEQQDWLTGEGMLNDWNRQDAPIGQSDWNQPNNGINASNWTQPAGPANNQLGQSDWNQPTTGARGPRFMMDAVQANANRVGARGVVNWQTQTKLGSDPRQAFDNAFAQFN